MRDLVPASSSAIPEPALAPLPDTLLLRSQRPFWGAAARVWIAFALIAAALISASGPLFWALIGLAVVAFFLFPALLLGLLRPVEKEVLAATPKTAPALLDALRNRRRVRLFAPFAWTAAQEGRLHLIRGDGRAAARAFAEAVRLGGLASDPPPSLVSAQAQALLVAEAPEQAREMLQLLARRGPLGPWERLHLGIALLLGGKVRVEEAREHVDAAQHALGGHARVLAARAWLTQRAGEGEAAIAALQAAETALHDAPDKLGQSLVERARRLLRPALKAQEKRARKHDRRGEEAKAKSPAEGAKGQGRGGVSEGTGAKGQVAAGRAGVAEVTGAKGQASVVVKSEPRVEARTEPVVAEATPAGGIVLALGPGTVEATGEKQARGEAERPMGKKKARREERRAARRAAKAERRATQRTASPARPAVRTSAPAKIEEAKGRAEKGEKKAQPVKPAQVEATRVKEQAQEEKRAEPVKAAQVEAARVEKPTPVAAGAKDRSPQIEVARVEKPAVEAGAKDRPVTGEAAGVEKPAIEAGAKDRPAQVEAARADRSAAVEAKDKQVEPVAAPASVASRGDAPAAAPPAVVARAGETAQRTGVGPARAEQAPARAEQAPAPPSGSALFGGLGKAAAEVVATPGVGPGRLPTLRPGTTAKPEEVPPAGAAPAASQRASAPSVPPVNAPVSPAVPKFTSPTSAPAKTVAPSVTTPAAPVVAKPTSVPPQAPVAKPTLPSVAPPVAKPTMPSVAPPVAKPTMPSVAPPVMQAPVTKTAAPSVAPPVAQAASPSVAPPVMQAPVAKTAAPSVAPPVAQAASAVAQAASAVPPVAQAPTVASPVMHAPVLTAPVAPVMQAPVLTAPVAPVMQAPSVTPPVVQAPSVAPPVVQAPVLTAPVAPPPVVQAAGLAVPAAVAPQPSAPTPQVPAPPDVAGAGDAEWDALLDAFDETS